MKITLPAVAIGISLTLTACLAGPAGSVQVAAGQSFSLRPGDSARLAQSELRVGFEAVSSDSRCPKGEQCVRAGDATVRIWLQQGSGPRQTRELRTSPGAGQSVRLQNVELRLLALDPHPVTGRPVATLPYVATFTLICGPGGDPER